VGAGLEREPALVQSLWRRAEACPGDVAYEFADGDGRRDVLTYGQLADRCRDLAAQLRERQPAGGPGPALVCYPPGIDYVVAILGCLAAGVPAIPAYPPQMWNRQAGLRRLEHIMRDSRPAHLLASPEMAGLTGAAGNVGGTGSPALADPQVAIVQYTSGSTAAPRGVAVTHANLAHNMTAIAATYGVHTGSQGVCWLPPYHDMGLITGILMPLFVGYPVRLLSPVEFLKDPLIWLRQLSVTSATFSGAPNFAYDLCIRRVTDAELTGLDLSNWSTAFNGAEPVRRRTLEEFASKFAPAGFRASALAPSYGLAEATLLVSGGYWQPSQRAGEDGRVRCGRPLPDQDLVVVDLATGRPAAEGEEGEIWLRGPSVTPGCWSAGGTAPHPSGELNHRRYLRTGDLGYLRDGELVITGRERDLIIRHGVNFHPEDIELAVLPGHTFRSVCAAFGADNQDGPAACLALESARTQAPAAAAGSFSAEAETIRARVVKQTGLRLDTVLVLPAGAIPRTSSGKVSRRECQEHFASGAWDRYVVAGAAARTVPPGAMPPPLGTADQASDGDPEKALAELVGAVFAAVCEVPHCPPEVTIFDIGGDSVRAAEAAGVLTQALGVDVPVKSLLELASPGAVARQLIGECAGGPARADLAQRIASLGTHDG
jgi:acyl-CoA synthetase (AMP-forming)/AMP-acid ligase II